MTARDAGAADAGGRGETGATGATATAALGALGETGGGTTMSSGVSKRSSAAGTAGGVSVRTGSALCVGTSNDVTTTGPSEGTERRSAEKWLMADDALMPATTPIARSASE